jgi:hypothetical protein
MDISALIQVSDANRIDTIQVRESGQLMAGDFEGSVTGIWIKLDESGAGIVAYGDKEYKTKRIGSASIPKGTSVELTFANGIYYSKW